MCLERVVIIVRVQRCCLRLRLNVLSRNRDMTTLAITEHELTLDDYQTRIQSLKLMIHGSLVRDSYRSLGGGSLKGSNLLTE